MAENRQNHTHKRVRTRIKFQRKGMVPMCAIAGIFDLPADEESKQRWMRSMMRRAAYDGACVSQEDMTLFHRRRNENACVQPYVLRRGDEEYTIVCDAAVYNAPELHAALCAAGEQPQQSGDAPLLLHAYLAWGERMPEQINGTFALMILCRHARKVFLARDRMGVKPLFYRRQNGGLLVASEQKTILAYPGVETQIDACGASELLLLGPGRTPGSGVFYDIHELEPGWCACYQGGNLRLRQYWKLRDHPHTDSFEETAETVRFLVGDAVARQARGVENLGTMLSGGLDSSVVSALCARQCAQCGERLQTFSVDYEDNDRYFVPGRFQPDTDAQYVRLMQEQLQSIHRTSVLTPEELAAGIGDATCARDLPGMADVDISLLAFCSEIRPHATTVLSGECADELFGGYPWYRDAQMRDVHTFPWAQTTAERTAFLAPWITQQVAPEAFVQSRYADTIAHADILPETNATDRRIRELVNLNVRWFMQTLIDRGDRMGAYGGVEIRMPFCDDRIATYLYSVPWSMKDYRGREKGLLRYAMEGLLPPEVLYRKKSPYPKTYHPRYLQIVSELLRDVLADENAPIFALVRHDALENLLTQDFAWPWYGQLMRRPQTIVYMLQINTWMKQYSVKIR